MKLTTGQILQNRYRVVSLLGEGGMGAVYRAWDMRLDVVVALKEMTSQSGLDPQMLAQLRQQFQQEAMTLARLHHPHLVRVTDFFEEGDSVYLVMDFVEGENLAHRIKQEGALSEAQVLEWGDHLLSALAYCHAQGVIHRDIKPQNVIIRPDGQAALVDFGLVKLWDPHDPRTRTAIHAMGTPEYAPPEQYDTKMGHTDPRSDIYSLGATLYHALTGQSPPTATMRIASPGIFQPPRSVNPSLSPRTEAAVLRATELAVGNRFTTAQEMAAVLRGEAPIAAPLIATQVQTGEATQVMPGAVLAPPVPRKRAPVWVWVLGALAVLALVAGGVIGVRSWKGGSAPTPRAEETIEGTAIAVATRGTEETATTALSPSPTRADAAQPTNTPTRTPMPTPSATSTPTETPDGTPKGTPGTTPTPQAPATPKTSPTSGTPAPTSTPQPTTPPSSGALITFEQWGTWRRGDQPYGELTQTQDKVRSGSYAAKLRYDFPATNEDYVVFVRSLSLAGQPNTIGAWVYGDGSSHFLNVWVQDAQNEIWSVHLGQVGASSWQQMAGTLAANLSWPSGHISGPDNGVVDYPVRFYALVLDRSGSGSRSGQIYIDDISAWQGQVSATATPAAAGEPPATSPPIPTSPPPPSGQVGRILYTIEAGDVYYLASTDPSWSQGQLIGPVAYAQSTCAGGATAQTLEGQTFNLSYGYRCSIGHPKDCPAPNGEYKVTIWEEKGTYSLSVHQVSDNALLQPIYNGRLNADVPILWAPDSSRFYFAINQTLHQANPDAGGYQPVIPTADEPYLSPDGSMILYRQPVGTVGAYDFWVVNADGSNPHNVTNAAETYKLCARWGR
jgi:serine/threonine protein kinase